MKDGVLAWVSTKAEHLAQSLAPIKAYVLSHYGDNGLMAAYIVLGVTAVLLVYRLLQLTFSAVKYVVLPSVALAFLGSIVSPLSFTVLLPATVAVCAIVFLFKG